MSEFWPDGLDLSNSQTPREFLEAAREEWDATSHGMLTLVFHDAESESGNAMIVVHAHHVPTNRTAELFSIVHRSSAPYPATIQPRETDLPKVLKKSYYEPGIGEYGVSLPKGHNVTNEWVSATPSEFRQKLKKAMNLEVVQYEIFRLVSQRERPA